MGTHNAWVREEGGGRHHQGCLKDHEGLRREDADKTWRGVEPASCVRAPLSTGTDVLASFYYILACLGGQAMSLGYTRLQGG